MCFSRAVTKADLDRIIAYWKTTDNKGFTASSIEILKKRTINFLKICALTFLSLSDWLITPPPHTHTTSFSFHCTLRFLWRVCKLLSKHSRHDSPFIDSGESKAPIISQKTYVCLFPQHSASVCVPVLLYISPISTSSTLFQAPASSR